MQKKTNKLILLIILVLASSCANQKHYAWKFVKNPNLQPILVIYDDNLYTVYNKPDASFDSLMQNKPPLIDKLVDNTTLHKLKTIYDSTLIAELKQIGFQTYTEQNISEFFSLGKPSWQLLIKQITFEEYRYIFTDDLYFSDYYITYDTILSDYEMNVWLELSPINNDSMPEYNFFSSFNMADMLKGKFTYNRNERLYKYDYSFYPIIENDFVNMAKNASLKHSQYLFDFFMNQFIFFNYKKANQTKEYMTFDRVNNKVIPAYTNRFIFLSD